VPTSTADDISSRESSLQLTPLCLTNLLESCITLRHTVQKRSLCKLLTSNDLCGSGPIPKTILY
jgi:hypothetical protein